MPFFANAGMEDKTAPTITVFSVSPNEVDTWDEDQTIMVTITVVDEDSGFNPISQNYDEDIKLLS